MGDVKARALGRLKAGVMNKTEAKYAAHLEAMRQSGAVLWYRFEAVTLKIADGVRYTPDSLVMMADLSLEVHEVKGYWMDDAKVKIRMASDVFQPFIFKAIFVKPKKDGGGWREDEF